MKILSASIIDPRRGGEYRNPYLALEVDEEIRQTGETSAYGAINGDWLVIPHGPFVAVDWQAGDYIEHGNLGLFNTTDHYRSKLVEVEVNSPDETIDLAMPVDRARRLLRKHMLSWKFIMDDVAGQHGKVEWRLVRIGLSPCIKCGEPSVQEVYFRGTHLNLCDHHVTEHNHKIRNMRIKSA